MTVDNLVEKNRKAVADSVRRFHAAIEKPTLAEAVEAYGANEGAFWQKASRLGLKDETKERYAACLAARKAEYDIVNREKLAAGRVIQLEMDRQKTADMIEDAEWLAITGEVVDRAVKRLGFKSWNTLYKRLTNNNRTDIAERLLANTEGVGKVRLGRYVG